MVTGQVQSHVVPDHRPETCRRECRTSSRRRRHGVKAGSAVPVKFSLGGDRGRAIFAVGFPTSAQVTCPAGTTPTSPVATTSAKSGLSYNALTGIYTYVWETKASWKGTCRLLRVKLADNSVREASFKF